MNNSVVIAPQAYYDLASTYAYLKERNPEAAIQFYYSAIESFKALADTPTYATRNPQLRGMRGSYVKQFRKYRILYQPQSDGITVLRVLHGARDIRAIMAHDE